LRKAKMTSTVAHRAAKRMIVKPAVTMKSQGCISRKCFMTTPPSRFGERVRTGQTLGRAPLPVVSL
jgi:hypothetical protein